MYVQQLVAILFSIIQCESYSASDSLVSESALSVLQSEAKFVVNISCEQRPDGKHT